MREPVLELTALLMLIALVVSGLIWVSSAQCRAKWERSGMQSEWVLFAGCRIQTADGKWIPAANYREMP